MKRELSLPAAPQGATSPRPGPVDRLLARLLASSLDHQLAAGGRPPARGALAIRARRLASPAGRGELARGWVKVMESAGRRPALVTSRGPLRRDAIAAAEWDVREMIAILASRRLIAARGAAMASWLLADGTGPLYSRGPAPGLGGAVREAIRWMDSAADAPPAGVGPDSAVRPARAERE